MYSIEYMICIRRADNRASKIFNNNRCAGKKIKWHVNGILHELAHNNDDGIVREKKERNLKYTTIKLKLNRMWLSHCHASRAMDN